MTPKERFIAALERKPIVGHVPHFELVFYLTMEAIGKVHPIHRHYVQWDQMSETEQRLQREDIADCYLEIAHRYQHDAIFFHPFEGATESEISRLLETLLERGGDQYFIMMHGDATFSIPDGNHMMDFVANAYMNPESTKAEAERMVDAQLLRAERFEKSGLLDGFALCSDYCFNTGPFLSPDVFSELITPYLARLTSGLRDMSYYVIKHTDGNIMPILDQLISTKPHALHSLDPQGHVDIAKVKHNYGDQVCLIGNVHCGMLSTGTKVEIEASARYALKNGMPGGGYIFSTSNCIFTGMPLENYETMWQVWRDEGVYTTDSATEVSS